MKFVVKNQFSINGNLKVFDENGKEIYFVKGNFFSLTNKKKIICSEDGKVCYVVKNKFFNWFIHTSYIFDKDKQKVARVKNRFAKGGFDVSGYGDQIAIDGWGIKGYSIVKNGEKIGEVKSNLSLLGQFEVEVSDAEDVSFIVAVIVAMNNVTKNASKRT